MSEALDGLLDTTQQAAFDAHLAQCVSCRKAYAALQETVAELQALAPVEPPTDLVAEINAAIDRPRTLQWRWDLFSSAPVRVALAASVMLVLGLMALPYLNPAPSLMPADTAPAADAERSAHVAATAPREAVAEAPSDDETGAALAVSRDEMADQNEAALVRRRLRDAPAATAAPLKDVTRPVAPPNREVAAGHDGAAVVASAVTDTDRERSLWREPPPAGVVGGLRAGEDRFESRQDSRALQVPAAPATMREPALAFDALRSEESSSLALRLHVSGMARETVLQALQDATAKKDAAMADAAPVAESRRLSANRVVQSSQPAAISTLETSLEQNAQVISLQLSRLEWLSFLQKLQAQDGHIAADPWPESETGDARVEIRLQIVP